MPKKIFSFFAPIAICAAFTFIGFPADATTVGNTSNATLTISPASENYNAGDNFTINIYLNTNNQNVVVVSAYLNYNINQFEALNIDTTGSIFSFEAEKIIDPVNVKIKIARGIPTPGVNTSNGLVAKVNFKALSNVTPMTDNLILVFIPGSSRESSVILDDGKGTNILSGVNNAKYTIGVGGQIYYGNGSLLKASSSEKVYLIDNNQKRWIPTSEIFIGNGYSWSSIVTVDPNVLTQYTDGPDMTITSQSIPEGGLIRAKGDIDVYIIKYVGTKKFKRLILSPSVFNSYQHLKWGDIKDVDKSVVDSYTTSELVRAVGDPKVYKLYPSGDTGQKRWIATADAFNRLGFDWNSIYEINQVDRNSYIDGASIE
jgi:hypothetical protein